MKKHEITFKVKVKLDDVWANNHTEEELAEYLRDRLETSLGYRATIKKFEVVKR